MKIKITCTVDFDELEHMVVALDATEHLESRILQRWGQAEYIQIENATFDQEKRPRTVRVRGNAIRKIEVEQ